MFARLFLSALIVGLFASFSVIGSASAREAKDYFVFKKANKKHVKRRPKASKKYIKRQAKLRQARLRQARLRRNKKRLVKKRRLSSRKRNISYPVYSNKKKKVTKASLGLSSIKNSRHARLTRKGRMSVAKDTRKNTVQNFGKRVSYKYRPGTVVISNYTRRLYYVVRRGKVISYPIATPRPDEVWSGSTTVSKKKFNPDWYPTPAMREKNPNLPEKVVGGSKYNPFGKRALYLGKSLYRIHGTNRPGSIGRSASGGCYRMHNNHIRKLWRKVKIGTPVVVLTRRKL